MFFIYLYTTVLVHIRYNQIYRYCSLFSASDSVFSEASSDLDQDPGDET